MIFRPRSMERMESHSQKAVTRARNFLPTTQSVADAAVSRLVAAASEPECRPAQILPVLSSREPGAPEAFHFLKQPTISVKSSGPRPGRQTMSTNTMKVSPITAIILASFSLCLPACDKLEAESNETQHIELRQYAEAGARRGGAQDRGHQPCQKGRHQHPAIRLPDPLAPPHRGPCPGGRVSRGDPGQGGPGGEAGRFDVQDPPNALSGQAGHRDGRGPVGAN